jgi:hypothetical protein
LGVKRTYVIYTIVVRNLTKTLKHIYYNLYLGKTNNIPKDENGKDFDVLYCLENSKKVSIELEENTDLRYSLVILQKTRVELNYAIKNVKSEWNNFIDLPLEIEHISKELQKMTRNFRELILEADDESVIFKSQVVGYDEKSVIESKEARKLILKVATKSKWNFWS